MHRRSRRLRVTTAGTTASGRRAEAPARRRARAVGVQRAQRAVQEGDARRPAGLQQCRVEHEQRDHRAVLRRLVQGRMVTQAQIAPQPQHRGHAPSLPVTQSRKPGRCIGMSESDDLYVGGSGQRPGRPVRVLDRRQHRGPVGRGVLRRPSANRTAGAATRPTRRARANPSTSTWLRRSRTSRWTSRRRRRPNDAPGGWWRRTRARTRTTRGTRSPPTSDAQGTRQRRGGRDAHRGRR